MAGINLVGLQGSLVSLNAYGSTTRFELVTLPQLGSIGWNNTLAGKFVYSPVDVELSVLGNSSNAKDSFKYRGLMHHVDYVVGILILPS